MKILSGVQKVLLKKVAIVPTLVRANQIAYISHGNDKTSYRLSKNILNTLHQVTSSDKSRSDRTSLFLLYLILYASVSYAVFNVGEPIKNASFLAIIVSSGSR